MRDFWNRVGSSDSISWPSLAVTFVIVLVVNLIGSGVEMSSGPWGLISASSLGAMAMFAFLLLAKYTILAGTKRAPQPELTILVILIALVVRAVAFDGLLMAWELEETPRVGYRFFASISTMGVTMVMLAYIVSLAREFSRNSERLRATNATLRATKNSVDAKIRAKREDVVGSVRAELEARLKTLTGTSAKQALKRVRETIEEVVRPVSYELAKQVTDLSPQEQRIDSDRVIWRAVFADSTSRQPFRPGAFSFWAGFATLCFAPLQWGFEVGVTLAFVASLVPFAALSAFATVWSRFLAQRGTIERSLLFTIMLFTTGLLGTFAVTRVSGMETYASQVAVPLAALWVFLGWGIALVPSLQTETARVLQSLNKSSDQLREELVRLNTAYRLQQQAIARALHGPIQDALSVASFKLSAAIQNGTATDKLVAELNARISSTIVLLDLDSEELPALEQSLSDLSEFWDGVATIRWSLRPVVKSTLANHPVTSATAIELIREACSNAVRHGRAGQIRVKVALSKDQTKLAITVTNDGALVTLSTKPGLGTKLLNELALSWSLKSENGTTVLEATTPII
jgi:signal transduction histidine kinase